MELIKLTAVILAITCMAFTDDGISQCGEESTGIVSISVATKRNQTGQWVTHFSTSSDEPITKLASNMTLDITQKVTECNGRRTIRIMGTLGGSPPDLPVDSNRNNSDGILFHSKCGKNVEIINGGKTMQKINPDDPINSVGFTNRPLRDNELFEVKLEKKLSKYSHSLGIGVTIYSPVDISFPGHMNHVKFPSWAMYHSHLYQNGGVVKQGYAKDLNTLVVGDRVGVMRTDKGNLHFYINGVDQGAAASNVPFPIYGMLELWHDAAKASITDSS